MKILVLQLKRIGDLVCTTPALAALRGHFPDARITLSVADGCAGLLPAMPGVTDALLFRRNAPSVRTWLRLALGSFDVCLDFTGNDRSAFFTLLSKAQTRATFASVQKSRTRSLFYNRFINSPVRERHTVDHYLALLGAVGVEPAPHPVTLNIPAESAARAAQLVAGAGVAGPFVLVHPGTARPEKYWLPQRWAEVIDVMRNAHGLPCVLTGSADVFEQEHVGEILRRTTVPVANLAGRLDLLTLAALTRQAALVLSVDSAPMHFAAAFGTPQVALFGPTNPFHWHPRHAKARVLAAGCEEPVREFLPRAKGAEMRLLTAGQLVNTVASLLHPNASS